MNKTNALIAVPLSPGRPVKLSIQALAVYVGVRGLILGPEPGQAAVDVMDKGPTFISLLFYCALTLGGLASIGGEIKQLQFTVGHKRDGSFCINKYMDGLAIEAAGDALITLNFAALAVAIFASSTIPHSRALIYLFLVSGFLFRCGQAIWEAREIRKRLKQSGTGDNDDS